METIIKFCGFYKYKKRINGKERIITRLVCFEDSVGDASRLLRENMKIWKKFKVDDYYIAEYDISGDVSVKLKEYPLND